MAVTERIGEAEHARTAELLAMPLAELMAQAAALRDEGHGRVQSWSRKIFIPLTQLCRNLCHYCTFSQPPRPGENAYMTRAEVLAVARAGNNLNQIAQAMNADRRQRHRITAIAVLAELVVIDRTLRGLLKEHIR